MKFTSEDLLKAMGLKVRQTVCVDNTMNFLIYEKGDIYFENLRSHSVISIDKFVEYILNFDYTIIQPKPTLTEDEKVILINLNKKYKWIARDKHKDELFVYENKPIKLEECFEMTAYCERICAFKHLFKFIKPMDCYSIEELLKEN